MRRSRLTRRSVLLAGPVFLVAVLAFLVTVPRGTAQDMVQELPADTAYEAPEITDTAGLPGPRQPIFFRHDVHAGQYEIDCKYCHVNAEVSPKPGIPTVSSCMNCHLIVGAGVAEVDSVRAHYNEGRTIDWIEVHYLSPFVRFPHQLHVNAEEEYEVVCDDCHGQVDRMAQIYQFASLKMGWCLDCHKEKTEEFDRYVSVDCTVCHY